MQAFQLKNLNLISKENIFRKFNSQEVAGVIVCNSQARDISWPNTTRSDHKESE